MKSTSNKAPLAPVKKSPELDQPTKPDRRVISLEPVKSLKIKVFPRDWLAVGPVSHCMYYYCADDTFPQRRANKNVTFG